MSVGKRSLAAGRVAKLAKERVRLALIVATCTCGAACDCLTVDVNAVVPRAVFDTLDDIVECSSIIEMECFCDAKGIGAVAARPLTVSSLPSFVVG